MLTSYDTTHSISFGDNFQLQLRRLFRAVPSKRSWSDLGKNRGYIEIVPEIITNNKINPNAGIEISKTLLRGSSTIDLSDNQLDVNLDGVINRIENKHFSDDYRRRLEMTKTNFNVNTTQMIYDGSNVEIKDIYVKKSAR